MNNRKVITLKSHLWMYFCTFAICIMAIMWILQIFFLGTFFSSMKLNEMKKVGNLIVEQYDVDDENFYKFWLEHSFSSGMFAQLVTEDGEAVQNFNTSAQNTERSYGENIRPGRNERPFVNYGIFSDIADKVTKSTKPVAFVEKELFRGRDASFAVYGSYIGEKDGEKVYLILFSPLERTDSTRKVIETQLIIATAISIILALILAYFIARRLSKPIEKTTLEASKLAGGDYGVKFSGGSYREIDKLADVLNHTASELSRTEELRRDLISNVSHDLRTPLTIIKSYAELIRDISGKNDEKRTRHTEVIVNEANNLSLLVSDMLDLSRIQSGTTAMKTERFNLASLICSTIKRFDYYREEYGIQFVVELCTDTAYAEGDSARIEQVVYNLLANAVNYTGEDKRIFAVLSENKDRYRVDIRDTGCGISPEEIPRVWDKYYRASGNYVRESVGTGIGLSIVKNILEAHGAEFGVNSTLGDGATFYFYLKKI